MTTTAIEQYDDVASAMKQHKKTKGAKSKVNTQYGLDYEEAEFYGNYSGNVVTPASKVLTVTASSHDCHSGCKRVMYMPKDDANDHSCGLYLGGWSRGAKPHADWAVIDLTGNQTDTRGGSSFVPMNPAAKEAFSTLSAPTGPWLSAKVQDYGVPTWTREDWKLLIECIRGLMHKGISVFMGCTGGHGRTGMVGAITVYHLAVDKSIFDPDPVTWLRKIYCDHIVETAEQMKYVWEILELTVPMPDAAKKSYQSNWQATTYSGNQTNFHTMRIHASNYMKPGPGDCWVCSRSTSKGKPVTINDHVVCEVCTGGNKDVKLCYFCDTKCVLVPLLPSWWDVDDITAFGVDMLPKVCFACLKQTRIDQSMAQCDICSTWTKLQLLDIDQVNNKLTCGKCHYGKDKPKSPDTDVVDADAVTVTTNFVSDTELTKGAKSTCFLCGGIIYKTGRREILHTNKDTGEVVKRSVHLGCMHVRAVETQCFRCGKTLTEAAAKVARLPDWWAIDDVEMFEEFAVPLCDNCIEKLEQ